MINKRWVVIAICCFWIVLISGCADTVPTASFDESREAGQEAEIKSKQKAREETSNRKEDAKESAKKTQEKLGESATEVYDVILSQAEEAQQLGINGLVQKFFYNIYLFYYKLCDYAIPLICLGWAIAIGFNFLFRKLPKWRKFGIMFFGFGWTGILCLILFAPGIFKMLGN